MASGGTKAPEVAVNMVSLLLIPYFHAVLPSCTLARRRVGAPDTSYLSPCTSLARIATSLWPLDTAACWPFPFPSSPCHISA